MRIFFLKRGKANLGSNRIYIENLSQYFSQIGIETVVSENILPDFDYYILSKYSKFEDLNKIRQINDKKRVICGIIHPSDLNHAGIQMLKSVDFAIVGSIEERDYYLRYKKNIFRFPQIEKIETIKRKHTKKNKIVISYHGNLEHLEEMSSATTQALERIHEKYNIELQVIYDKSLGTWRRGRPNIKVAEIDWTLDNVINYISKSDIGIVPCTNNFFLDAPINYANPFSLFIKFFTGGKNRRLNDYILRFKSTSNAGRSFIFHQLGIPVIADFWPSNFEILGAKDCGYLAHSENAWYNSLEKLICSEDLRNEISLNAQLLFEKNYKANDWAKKLISNIKSI